MFQGLRLFTFFYIRSNITDEANIVKDMRMELSAEDFSFVGVSVRFTLIVHTSNTCCGWVFL